jgi:hypothetical protein
MNAVQPTKDSECQRKGSELNVMKDIILWYDVRKVWGDICGELFRLTLEHLY